MSFKRNRYNFFLLFAFTLATFFLVQYGLPKLMSRQLTYFVRPIRCENRRPNFCGSDTRVVLDQLYNTSAGRKISIAIGMAITLKGKKIGRLDHLQDANLLLFDVFLPSFCRSITEKDMFEYSFYIAYDSADVHLSDCWTRHRFQLAFDDVVRQYCSDVSVGRLKLVESSYSANPAWSQNDAMQEAYIDGADYFYRVNDDTYFHSREWTASLISSLLTAPLANVGVVAPRHSGGAEDIMTYDFVHRTHVDIFGFYYPRDYKQWYADTWMSYIYKREAINASSNNFMYGISKFINQVSITHTTSEGRRYERTLIPIEERMERVKKDRRKYTRYLEYRNSVESVQPDSKKIIILIAENASAAVWWGCLRNSLNRPIYFPNWRIKILHTGITTADFCHTVRDRVLKHINLLDHVGINAKENFWEEVLKTILSEKFDFVILRSCSGRLLDRDYQLVEEWIDVNKKIGDINTNHVGENRTFDADVKSRTTKSHLNGTYLIDNIINVYNLKNSSNVTLGSITDGTNPRNNFTVNNTPDITRTFYSNRVINIDDYSVPPSSLDNIRKKAILSIKDSLVFNKFKLPVFSMAIDVQKLSRLIHREDALTVLKKFLKNGGTFQHFVDSFLWQFVSDSVEYYEPCSYDNNTIRFKILENKNGKTSYKILEFENGENFVGQRYSEHEEPYWRTAPFQIDLQ